MNSLPSPVTRQRNDCDLNPGPSAPESSTLTTRLPSHRNSKDCRHFKFVRRELVTNWRRASSCTALTTTFITEIFARRWKPEAPWRLVIGS